MFRRERPQKGRYRQFYQMNVEVLGAASPLVDVQLIFMLVTLFNRLAVSDVKAHINSLGCPDCRPKYREALSKFLASITDKLCSDCQRRRERNPLRVLDCKGPSCREALTEAPSILDYLCDYCTKDFETVKNFLKKLKIPFVVDKRLVRGLDYYTRTTFEIQTTTFEIQTGSLGAQSAVAGGGRYDGLVKMLGGPDLPATGFAIGLDRLAEVSGIDHSDLIKKTDLFVAALGAESQSMAFEWICRLSRRGIAAEMDLEDRSLKTQMKRADRLAAAYVLIVGEKELEDGAAILRNMATKEQISIPIDGLVEKVKEITRP
jgi:histidyl-tRNA synthetase